MTRPDRSAQGPIRGVPSTTPACPGYRPLEPSIAELARVLRPAGRILLFDLHPTMSLLGGTALFFAADGSAGNVRSYQHLHNEYLASFRAAGLEVLRCMEPCHGESELPALSGGLMDFAAEAFRTAWVGLPGALVWELTL